MSQIEFEEDGEEYWFDPETADTNYTGTNGTLRKQFRDIEESATKLKEAEDVDLDKGSTAVEQYEYSPDKARKMVVPLLERMEDVNLLDDGESDDSTSKAPQIVEGPLSSDNPSVIEHDGTLVKDNELILKEVPDEATHIPPDEDPPQGAVTIEGPRGGTHAIMPEDLADTMDGVTAEEIEEEMETVDYDSDAASDKIPEEDREVPDGVEGPIESWDPDNVEEIVSPNMRYAEIGSDAHPLFYRRPEPDELDEYVEAVREEEEWQQGFEEFQDGFAEGNDTRNEYTDEDGNWDEERLEKHDEWTDELTNPEASVPDDEQATGMLVLGPPGAGKGYWQEQVEEGEYGDDLGGKDFTHVNSDETKEPIPEYEGTNASTVHKEASKMAKDDLADKAVNDNQNVMLDKVGTTPGTTLELMEQMQEAGYDLRASFVEVPDDKAAHNAVSRFYQEGRFTPFDYLLGSEGEDSAGSKSRQTFETVLEELDIPEEKTGEFNNDVEWGDVPDAEQVGEELLKMFIKWIGGDLAQKYAEQSMR